MIEFNDIDFRNHGPEGPHHHPCEEMHPHPCPPPFNPELKKLFDLAAHADRIAHKALELARYANLDATSAKKLAEQALAIVNRVSTVAERANTKADTALAEIELIKTELQALVSELDATQAGAGLDSAGKYIKDTTTNYIQNATSLANADKLLDGALKEVSDSVESLESELNDLTLRVVALENKTGVYDNAIVAVGLNTRTGNYVKAGREYSIINTANSVLEATEMLDEAIRNLSENVDDIQDSVEELENLQDQVDSNTEDIQALKNKDIELKRFIDANTRNITTNANNIAANSSNITANTLAIAAANSRVSTVERRVDSLEGSMAPTHALAEQANQRVSVVEGRVDTLTGNVATLQGNVSSLQSAVTANTNDITSLETSIGNIALSKTGELEYTLMVNGHAAGKINIPQDQFLQQVHYDPATKMLTFTFVDGTTIQPIYIGDLVDTYTAGNGINISGSQISAKIDPQSELFLSATANGLKLSGIQTAIDKRYQAGVGLKRSAQPNAEGEYVFDVQIQENSRPYLSADVDGIGIDLNALKQEIGPFDPSTLAGNHLVYNAVTGTLNVNVSSLVSDPTFINAVTEIVQSALLWEPKEGATGVIQPKNNKSVYVNGTIEAAGSIYSGS